MRKQFWESPEEEEVFVDYLEKMGIAWWVEIITKDPKCIYYFGPFSSSDKAQSSSASHIEDLEQKNVQVINVDIKRGQPRQLTIFEHELEAINERRLQAVKPNFIEAWLR